MKEMDEKIKAMKTEVRVALYCRLSKDDDSEGESTSIGNQRDFMTHYCEEQGWKVKGVYQDSGYSGLSLERPELKKLLLDVENKEFDMVLTKDSSRLSRNYAETSNLVENFFPKHKVRYLSLDDSIDSEVDSATAPMRFLFNEMYSKDVSNKVHFSYLSKAKQGKFTGCVAPLGYKKSAEDKNQLEIDPDTAWIIEKIYDYAYDGHGTNYIRRRLEEDEVPCPTWWNRQKGIRNKTTKHEKENPETGRFIWDFTSIKEIIENPVYIGSIASQKTDYRFKTGWIKDKKVEEWIIVPDMHEPIIEKEIFDIVSEKVKSRKRADAYGNFSLFAGLIKCGDCGKALGIKDSHCKKKYKFYTCSRYTKMGKNHCTQHRIRYDVLYQLVLKEIQHHSQSAVRDKESAVENLNETLQQNQNKQLTIAMKSLEKDEKRLATLERIIAKLYEDLVSETITELNFEAIMKKSQKEQETLKQRVSEKRKFIENQELEVEDNSYWIELMAEHGNVNTLEPEMLQRLVKKIVVYEECVDGAVKQDIQIYFNFMKEPINLL